MGNGGYGFMAHIAHNEVRNFLIKSTHFLLPYLISIGHPVTKEKGIFKADGKKELSSSLKNVPNVLTHMKTWKTWFQLIRA